MVEINKSLDGTLEKAIAASAQLKGMPGFIQKYMLRGDFTLGKAKMVDGSQFIPKKNDPALQNYVAQLANLDKSQQNAVFRMTELDSGCKKVAQSLLESTASNEAYSTSVMQSQLHTLGLSEADAKLALQQAELIDSSGNYLIVSKDWQSSTGKSVKEALAAALGYEKLANSVKDTRKSEEELAAATIEGTEAQQAQTAATWLQKFALDALHTAISLAKQALVALAVGIVVKKIQAWYKSVTEVDEKLIELADDMKEAGDKADELSSSISDLISQYEKLGDTENWDTDDLETAKNLNEEIVDTLKGQEGVSAALLYKLDLQNGKYQDQLNLLRQIQKEQLQSANSDLTDEKNSAANVLKDAAKKKLDTNGTYVFGSDRQMADLVQSAIGGASVDSTFYDFYQLGSVDLNDADSVLDYYNKLQNALSLLEGKYTTTELSASKFYNWLKNNLAEIKESATAYQEASDALQTNSEKLGKFSLSEYMAANKPTESTKLSNNEIDAKIKATKEYQDAVKEAEETEAEWTAHGFNKYGNVDNFHRDKIDWTDENLKKYNEFVAEQNKYNPGTIEKGGYSTVLGSAEYLYRDDPEMPLMAYTPMLQTEDGLVPLTEDQVRSYIETIAEESWTEDDTLDLDKLMKLDAEGLERNINGEMIRVKGMIAGVEGGTGSDGKKLTRADILAMSGDTNEQIIQDYYGDSFDPESVVGMGNLSRYVGKSMHDAQATAQEGKDNIEAVYNKLYSDLENGPSETGADSAAVRYVDHIQSAFETLADSLGKDSREMTISDVVGLDSEGVELTEEQATALDTLRAAADQYGTTIQGVAQAGEENGLFGGIENAIKGAAQAAKEMETIVQNMDNIQSAYKACTSAAEEYNKYGYMSVDSLQSLLTMDNKYIDCLDLINGKLQVNKQAYADLLAAQYADAAVTIIHSAQLEIEQLTTDKATDSTENLKDMAEDEKDALNNLLPALKDAATTTAVYGAAAEYAAAAEEASENGIDQSKIDEITERTNKRLSLLYANMNAALQGGQSLANQLNGFGSSTKNAAKSANTFLDAWSTLSSAMEEYNKWGGISLNTMKSLMGIDSKYTSCLKKQGNELVVDATACRDLIQAELKQAAATDDGTGKVEQYNQVLEYLNTHAKNGTISLNQLKDAIEGVNTALDEATGKTDEFQSGMEILHDLSKIDNANGEQIADYDTLKKVTELVTKHPELDGIFLDENGNLNVDDDKIKKAAEVLIGKVIKAANDSGQTGLAKLWSNRLEQLNKGDISMTDFWNGFGTDIEDANTKLDKFQSTFSTFRSALEEIQETGSLKSQDILQELGQIDQSFLDQFVQDDGTYKINATGLRDMYVKQLEPLMKEFDGTVYGDYLKKMYDAVRAPTEEEYDALVKATSEYKAAEAKCNAALAQIDKSDASDEDKEAAKKAALDELTAVYNQKYQDVQETDAQVMAKLIAHWEEAKNAVEGFKSALSDAKAVLSSFLSLLSTLNDKSNNDLKIWGDTMNKVIDKRIKALNKQKEALEENNDATERAIELSKAQDALARAQQQRTTRVYTENGYEWQANAEDVRTAREDLADKKREWNKADAEKTIDDQIKKYNEFKDKLSEVMDDIGKSWKDYQKELEYTAQIQQMTITQMEGSLDGYHNKIIASLNTGSAITSIQNLITNLESLINTLTKVNNLYSWAKTGEYKDLGTTGLWNTIKGFFNKGGEEAAAESGKTVETFFEKLSSKVQTSGNDLIEKFKGIWKAIKAGAHDTFTGSGSGGGIISTVVNGFKTIGSAVKNSKVGATLIKGAGKLVAGAGGIIKGAAGAISAAGASAIPVVGAVAAAAGLGIYGGIKNIKHQKEIWSNKDDSFGKKALKSFGTFIWDTSPIGAIVNLCKDIFGKSKETAENTKDTANSSSETAENTKKATGISNLTINATQGTISEENKTEEKKQSKWDKFWGSKFWFWNWGKKASGDKKIKHSGTYNVDEVGPEMLVRQPASGRYTYLETGDGVVPADITSRLFEMGGNPDKWFSDQLAKNGSASMVQSRSSGGISLSIGDVNVNNPVGDSDALARELVNRLPNKVVQELNRR